MNDVRVPLLEVDAVSRRFVVAGASWRERRRIVNALHPVSFVVRRGETLGIVGESGSGKTTLARMLVHLLKPTSGAIRLLGRELGALSREEVLSFVRRKVRMVFQDPQATMNPAYRVRRGLEQALLIHGIQSGEVEERLVSMLGSLGLAPELLEKYPDELSGGEKRRIGIGRALLTDPELIVADEPLSGLDVLLQERVLALLKAEQERRGFGLVLVSHDLDRVNQVCDRVLVLHSGHVLEDTRISREDGLGAEHYRHPYSVLLRQASLHIVPPEGAASTSAPDVETSTVTGRGCPVTHLCRVWESRGRPEECVRSEPPRFDVGPAEWVRCHFGSDLAQLARPPQVPQRTV